MKAIYLTVVGLLLQITAYSQHNIIQADTTVKNLKDYLEKNIKYPPVSLKDYTQGTMIVGFKINKDGKINDSHIVRHIADDCDSTVIRTLNNYSGKILLPPNEYTVGLQFFILEDGKPDSEIVPIDKSRYKHFLVNFLFELNVTAEGIKEIHTSIVQ